MAKLTDFMVSRVRVKVYKALLEDPQEMYYVRQLVRKTDEEINAVRRELGRMEKRGMVTKEPRGNRLYYQFNPSYPFFADLLALVAKTTGLGGRIIKNKSALGRVNFALLSGRFTRHLEPEGNQVDLILVGQIKMSKLAELVQETEKKRGREVNYTVMTLEEFKFRKNRRDPFILQIISGSRVMLIGDEQDFVSRKMDETEGN